MRISSGQGQRGLVAPPSMQITVARIHSFNLQKNWLIACKICRHVRGCVCVVGEGWYFAVEIEQAAIERHGHFSAGTKLNRMPWPTFENVENELNQSPKVGNKKHAKFASLARISRFVGLSFTGQHVQRILLFPVLLLLLFSKYFQQIEWISWKHSALFAAFISPVAFPLRVPCQAHMYAKNVHAI